MKKHNTQPTVLIEIPARDSNEADEFYSAVFGWQIEPSVASYALLRITGGPESAFAPLPAVMTAGPLLPSAGTPLIYLGTDDIDATVASVEAHGGKTLVTKTENSDVVRWAVVADPTGNPIVLYTHKGDMA